MTYQAKTEPYNDAGLHNLEGKKILVVDDEETNYLLIKGNLFDTDVKIFWARVGQEAIDMILRGEQFDLVFMDVKMPVMDGFETTKKIKKIIPSLPVIAQTAYAAPEEIRKCRAAGCDDYISKPYNLDTLMQLTIKYLKV